MYWLVVRWTTMRLVGFQCVRFRVSLNGNPAMEWNGFFSHTHIFDVGIGTFNHQLTCSLFSRTPNVNILKIASSPPRSAGLMNIGGDFDSIVSKGFDALISIPGTINNSYVYLLMGNSFSN